MLRGHVFQHRIFLAPVETARTPGREPAAGWQLDQVRRQAVDGLHAFFYRGTQLGHGLQQPVGIGVLRIVEQRIHRTRFDDPAGVHDDHPVAHLAHDAEIVGDDDDGHIQFFLELHHQFQDLCLYRDVQRRGRLVGDEQFRVARDGHGDHDALPHPPAELVGVVVQALLRTRNVDHLQQFDAAVGGLFLVEAEMELKRFPKLPSDGQHRVERRHGVLEHHGDDIAPDLLHFGFGDGAQVHRRFVGAGPEQDVAADDAARGARDEPHDREHGGALSATALPHDAHRFSFRHLEIDVVHGPYRAAAGEEVG